MGAPVDGSNIVTAARATALALRERAPQVTMVLGGVCSLATQWNDSRFLERFGAAAVGLAASIYAWSLALQSGLPRTFTIAIFVSMAIAAVIRYLRSTAYVRYGMNKRDGHPHG